MIGGAGNYSGSVGSYSTVGSVFIGGSLKGPTLSTGMVSVSGEIVALGAIQSVTILGDLRGGTITGDAHLSDSGYIAATVIGHVTIGGSVIAGTDNSASGSLVNTGAIRAIDTLGSVKIGENLLGTTGTRGVVTEAAISVRGHFQQPLHPAKRPDFAIARLTIGGNVEHASIEAGVPNVVIASFGFSSPANADAQFGPVSVGGEWLASNLVAGAAATDGFYGDTNDAKLSGAGVRDQADHFSKSPRSPLPGRSSAPPRRGITSGLSRSSSEQSGSAHPVSADRAASFTHCGRGDRNDSVAVEVRITWVVQRPLARLPRSACISPRSPVFHPR